MKKVLIVDDKIELAAALGMIFEIHGYEAMHAGSGEEALTMMDDGAPDVVIVDYMMPKMNGVQLLKLIRSIYQDEKIARILMSAVCDRKELQHADADAIFTKPSDFGHLMQTVRELTSTFH